MQASGEKRIFMGGLALLVLAAFGITAFGGFVFDDRFVILQNRYFDKPKDWSRFFTEDGWAGLGVTSGNYRPLPMLSFAVDHLVFDAQPMGRHIENIAIHLVAAFALLFLAIRLGLSWPAAFLAAAFFAVHPLQTEPVAALVGRMDLMAGAAALGSLYFHVRYRSRLSPGKSEKLAAALAVALFAIGLLSKEHVILIPLVALAYDWRFERLHQRSDLRVHGVYLAVIASYLLARAVVFDGEILAGSTGIVSNPLAFTSAPLRIVSALRVAGLYLWHTVAPVGLSPDYCYAQILPFQSLATWQALTTIVLSTVILMAGTLLFWRSRKAGVAVVLIGVTFLPVSNILFPGLTVMGDRLFYTPLAGFGLLLGLAYQEIDSGRMRVVSIAIAAIVIGSLTTLSVIQASQWRTNLGLFRLAVGNSPECTRAHSNLGNSLLDIGDLEGAKTSFKRSLEIYPKFDPAIEGLAQVALEQGQYEVALEEARRALSLRPDMSSMLELAGDMSRRLGDLTSAEMYWKRLVEIDPHRSDALSDLAILKWRKGEREAAIGLWEKAKKVPDAAPEVWFNVARALDEMGRHQDAKEQYEAYLSFDVPIDTRRSVEERLKEIDM